MNETYPPHRVLRRSGAVFAGLLVIVILSIGTDMVLHAAGVYPPWGEPMDDGLCLLASAYRMLFGIAGCYLAARLAPDRPMGHALALGFIGVAVGVVGAIATWDRGPEFGPRWYALVIFVIPLPCAWAGGKLHDMRDSRHAT